MPRDSIMIIGLTGRNASGKGEMADYLVKKGFGYFSLSDEIREEIKAAKLEVTRENLIQMGNKLRSQFGAGILAEKILSKLKLNENYIIDSIRNPAEVEVLRRLKDFIFVNVTALPEIRFERIKKRARESDPQTFEDFLIYEARELGNLTPIKQQVDECEVLADVILENNSTLEEFHKKIDEFINSAKRESSE